MKFIKILKHIVVAFFLLFSISCTKSGKNNKGENKMTFRYNESAGISDLDPAFSRNLENIWAVNQLYNGLVEMNSNMEVSPSIAKNWKISENGKVYTFYLRKGVHFHDNSVFENSKGREVTAQDFEYSFKRILDDKTASPGEYIFKKVEEFKALNDSCFQVKLSESFPPFLEILTMMYCSVVPKEAVEEYGKDFSRNPVGTGPFKLKVWKKGVKLILVKNKNYWEKDEKGNQLPYLDAVEISFNKDRHTAFLEFNKGTYDYLSGLDGSFKDEVLTSDGKLSTAFKDKVVLQKESYLKTDYLGILMDPNNKLMKSHPLLKKNVRKAMAYAINKKKMIKYLRNKIGEPANEGFIPKGMMSYDKKAEYGYEYNLSKADSLLRVAGHKGGRKIPTIKLTTTSNYTDLCEYIQNQLSEIGLKVKVNVIPASNHREFVAKSRVRFFRKSWVADYPDAQNFLSLFYSKNKSPEGPNYTQFENKEFDSLYEKAMHI
ncbi:MAG: ABC transporter substrate-binding protein, partial [Flavobacteriales bacterium]